jgi:hypothetical protein
MIAGILLLITALGFIARSVLGGPDAKGFPAVCLSARIIMTIVGAGCVMRGISLVRGTSEVEAGGTLLIALMSVYSTIMLALALKAGFKPPDMRSRRPVAHRARS